MTYPCSWRAGCLAVVDTAGDLCPAHYNLCGLCGNPRAMHPVVQFTDQGPVTRCSQFQHEGMKEPRQHIKGDAV